MRYPGDRLVLPLFGPWRWAPYTRGKFYWKKYQNARSFFLSHTTKLNQQKQWDVVPKSTAKIDPSNKYNIFPSFIIDQSWNTLQLKETKSATMNMFRKIFFSFNLICKRRIKLNFHNKSVHYSWKLHGTVNYLIKTGMFSLVGNYLRPSNNFRHQF